MVHCANIMCRQTLQERISSFYDNMKQKLQTEMETV